MIEFSGALSNNSWQYLLKEQYKFSCFAAVFTGGVHIILFLVGAVVWRRLWWMFLLFSLFIILICFLLAFPKTNPQEKNLIACIPKTISVGDNKLERFGNGKNSYGMRKIEDVKKVIDMGDWYIIDFYFPNKDGYFLCQKDLITQGTIEEFESLFADKIVRKKLRK